MMWAGTVPAVSLYPRTTMQLNGPETAQKAGPCYHTEFGVDPTPCAVRIRCD